MRGNLLFLPLGRCLLVSRVQDIIHGTSIPINLTCMIEQALRQQEQLSDLTNEKIGYGFVVIYESCC